MMHEMKVINQASYMYMLAAVDATMKMRSNMWGAMRIKQDLKRTREHQQERWR